MAACLRSTSAEGLAAAIRPLRADRGKLHSRARPGSAVPAYGSSLLVLCTFLLVLVAAAPAQNLQSTPDQNTIRGTVVNAITHQPIPRALVHSADDRYAMMTDGDGHFEFTVRPGNQMWLLARKPGFLGDNAVHRPGLFSLTQAAIETSSDSNNEVTIPLTPESIIKGRVSTSTGDTPPRIQVQLLARQIRDGFARWTPAETVQTKSDGSFRFAELASGSYKVMTHESLDNDPVLATPGALSYGFPPVYFPTATDFSGGATIDLAAGQTFTADLIVTDQPYYPVKIPVANGDANSGMNVEVSLQGRHGPGYSLGYNMSTHKIEGLLPNGSYTVRAFSYGPDSGSGELNLRVAGAPVEGAPLTVVRNSAVTLEVQQVLTQSNTANGAGARNSFAARGAQSYVYPRLEPADDFATWGGGSVRPQQNPSDNSLVIENVLPGRYWLHLTTGQGYVASATMGGIDLLHQPFEVASGSTIPIEITVRDDAATLQGTFTNASSSPNGQTWIYCVPLADSPGRFQQASVGPSEGKFNLAGVAPGGYLVLAFASQQRNLPYRDADAMRAYDSKGQVIQLAAGQSASVQLQIVQDE